MSAAAGTTAFEQVVSPSLDAVLSELDPEIAAKIDDELGRQRGGLEMIASRTTPLWPSCRRRAPC